MMADASGETYAAFTTLTTAREHPASVVIFEGDYGGTIYLTIPVNHVACDEAALKQLLLDIDSMYWSDPGGTLAAYEVVPIGGGVAGGMGGGLVVDGLWLHPEIEALDVGEQIEQVLNGRRPRIDTAGKRRR
jgi:hypothetical protein